jgi:chromosome segregation ATPase
MPSEELIRLKAHLGSLEAFLHSPAHTGFVAARQEEIRVIEETLLDIDPVNHETEIEHFKFRGERRCLKSMITVFADAMEELKDRIADLEDEETDVVAPNEDR